MQIIYKSPCERPGRSIEKLAVLVEGFSPTPGRPSKNGGFNEQHTICRSGFHGVKWA
jgi:hypothetical protein